MKRNQRRCNLCEGAVEKTTAPLIRDDGRQLIVLRFVPADVCERCGATSFSLAVARQAQRQIDRMAKVAAEVVVQAYAGRRKRGSGLTRSTRRAI